MHLTLYEQSEIFRYAFLFGLLLGMLYDVFRLIRAVGFDSQIAVFIQDVAFMILCAVLCFLFAQATVHGHFRLFAVSGHFLGVIAYRITGGIITGYIFKHIGAVFKVISRSAEKAVITLSVTIHKLFVKITRNMCKKDKVYPCFNFFHKT